MLISHKKRFIYLKTIKTAGTSIEIYFERECVDPSMYDGPRHLIDETCSEWGVVGYRGESLTGKQWFNHMPARAIRDILSRKAWDSYFKFCVVRNPFDKVVSYWWMTLDEPKRKFLTAVEFGKIRSEFKQWVMSDDNFPIEKDRATYTIDGRVCVDYVLRYESLLADLKAVCGMIGVDFEPWRLGRYKSESRTRQERFSDYYDG